MLSAWPQYWRQNSTLPNFVHIAWPFLRNEILVRKEIFLERDNLNFKLLWLELHRDRDLRPINFRVDPIST